VIDIFYVSIDFRWFYGAARVPAEAIYFGPPYTYIYPPTGIALIRPLALTGYWTGFAVLTALSVGGFTTAVARVAGWKVAALSLFSLSALQGLLWGQIAMLLAAALFAALCLDDFRKGVIIGALIVLKPQIFIAAPIIFALRREFTTLAGVVTGSSILVALAIALYGPQPWADWLMMLPAVRNELLPQVLRTTMASPIGFAQWSAWPVWPFLIGSLVLAALIMVRSRSQTDPISTAAIIGGSSILCAPYALSHDVILIVPAAVVTVVSYPRLIQVPAVGVLSGMFLPISIPLFLVMRRPSHDLAR